MDLVFVVPGIMGSELFLEEERIWPPKILRKVENPDELLDPKVRVGDLIRRVYVITYYDKLLNPLKNWGYGEGSAGSRGLLVPWPYNWLRGVPETARLLAQSIREHINSYPDSQVVLLAHSMGGLVCTYALECLDDGDVEWRKHVRLLVTFGTPFLGAPGSLLNAFGLIGVIGIAADDCQRLMADPAFPSGYQLLPHLRTLSSWEPSAPLNAVKTYQDLNPGGPPLGAHNLHAALSLQQALRDAKPNPPTRKFNFCGAHYKTVWGVKRAAQPQFIVEPLKSSAGDGTVPSWSGRQHEDVQFAPLGEKHSATFGANELLANLRLLLAPSPTPPGSPGGEAGEAGAIPAPPPEPHSQPRVSATHNAVSTVRSTVEIEIAEPPKGGILSLAWISTPGLDTPEELAARASRAGAMSLSASLTLRLDQQLGFPLRLDIPTPPRVGAFALAAWAGAEPTTISKLDKDRMDVVWYFADRGRGGDATSASSTDVPELPPEVAPAVK